MLRDARHRRVALLEQHPEGPVLGVDLLDEPHPVDLVEDELADLVRLVRAVGPRVARVDLVGRLVPALEQVLGRLAREHRRGRRPARDLRGLDVGPALLPPVPYSGLVIKVSHSLKSYNIPVSKIYRHAIKRG